MPSTCSSECPVYGRCLSIAITNIHCFSSHLVPSAFTSVQALRERERENCYIKKVLVCPKASMTWKKAGAWCWSDDFFGYSRGKPAKQWSQRTMVHFILHHPKVASVIFLIFFSFLGRGKESSFSYYSCHHWYLSNNNSLSEHRKYLSYRKLPSVTHLFAFNLYFV